MKKIFIICFTLSLIVNAFGQAPQKMSYQAIIRNSDNLPVISTSIGIRISIKHGSTGPSVYSETHTIQTDQNGLLSLLVGTGTPTIGVFSEINWSLTEYYIATEVDVTGGTNYTIGGQSQLLSVPYALYAENVVEPQVGGYSHYLGEFFQGGIIYDLYRGADGLEHGFIVSTTESNDNIEWQTINSICSALSTWDGHSNTSQIINSPAKDYASSLGEGWYIPSPDELRMLFSRRYFVNKTLDALGFPVLIPYYLYYWTSYEYDTDYALAVNIGSSGWFKESKSASHTVRAIRAF